MPPIAYLALAWIAGLGLGDWVALPAWAWPALAVLRTDQHGAKTLQTDGREMWVKVQR